MLGLRAMCARFRCLVCPIFVAISRDWDSDYNFDRTQTINQLAFVTLPQRITPGISSRENPIGEILFATQLKVRIMTSSGRRDRGLGPRKAAQDRAGRDRRVGASEG